MDFTDEFTEERIKQDQQDADIGKWLKQEYPIIYALGEWVRNERG